MVVHSDLVCRATGQAGAETLTDCAPSLTCDHEAPIIANCLNPGDNQSRRIYDENGHAPALASRESSGGEQSGVLIRTKADPPYIIRRLSPMECGRLQGFPDGWAEIAPLDVADESEVAFWQEAYKTGCAMRDQKPKDSILQKPESLARWHDSLHSDAAEYRMWGNGMALPNALFVVRRIVTQLTAERCVWPENVKLGSLFDGSGTMPLAAEMCGARAVWASEVEPYPIAVTKTHLPYMKHLGDIRHISGAELEPVDVIAFGSPCQDLSIAGQRAGLDGERSGLFREAVRIIKEMRMASGGGVPAVCNLGKRPRGPIVEWRKRL